MDFFVSSRLYSDTRRNDAYYHEQRQGNLMQSIPVTVEDGTDVNEHEYEDAGSILA
jgi:hypothetical protein